MTSQDQSTISSAQFVDSLELDFSIMDQDIESHILKLKDSLEHEDLLHKINKFQETLKLCLSICPVDILEEGLFVSILPLGRQLFLETLNTTKESTAPSRDNVKASLESCERLLESWEECLHHVEGLQRVSVSRVKSLVVLLPEVAKRAVEHCKVSQSIYGPLFTEVSKELAALFHKTNSTLKLFFDNLERVILFDANVKSDIDILINVIDTITEIAVLVHGIDLKTLADVWTEFGKLASIHRHGIIRVLPTCITVHLKSLSDHIISLLNSSLQNPDSRNGDRSIKCCSLLFKNLNKICSAYCGYLDSDTIGVLINLLAEIHRNSPSCLRAKGINERVIKLIEHSVTIGTEPFLNTIFKEANFQQIFLKYGEEESNNAVGYHLLTLSIVKKLISTTYTSWCIWLQGPFTLLDLLFKNIELLHQELCVGQLRIQNASGNEKAELAIYDVTVLSVLSLISQVPASDFEKVELHLLKYLLSGEFWSSLLALDTWGLIGRLGSSELCYEHVNYLIKIYETLIERESSLEIIMLSCLIRRLYSFLSEDMKDSLVTKLTSANPQHWMPLKDHLSLSAKSKLYMGNSSRTNDISIILSNLYQQPCMKNWTDLIMIFKKIEATTQRLNDDTMRIIENIWKCISRTVEECEGMQKELISRLIIALLGGTRPEKIDDKIFSTILSYVISIYPHMDFHVRVKISHYLKDCLDIFTDCDSTEAANAVASLYCCLLEDQNPWVRQESLESFNRLAHACPNDTLITNIASAISGNPLVRDSMRLYLSNTLYYKLERFPSLVEYMYALSRDYPQLLKQHVCYERNTDERHEKKARVESPVEPTGEYVDQSKLEERVNNVCEELKYFICNRESLSTVALEKLRKFARSILD